MCRSVSVETAQQGIDHRLPIDEAERQARRRGREHLADVKCPRSVDFRPELPRHPTGKLYKRLLKDEYWSAAGRSI